MISINVRGIKELRKTIHNLPPQFLKSAEKAVLAAGARPIARAAKRKAPVGKGKAAGLLKKSIGVNVKKVGSVVSARIGARSGFRVSMGKRKLRQDLVAKSRKLGKIVAAKAGTMVETFKDPRYYSHLVERGSRHSRPQPFIRPAIDSAKGETLKAMSDGLEKYLHRTARRLAKKANAA